MRFVPLGQDDSPSQEDQYTFVPLDKSSQASTQPEVSGDTDQEVVTSARAWRGAGGGRGSFADPRRLDQESGRTLQKVEKNLDQLERINPRSREELRPYAESLASAPESTAKPADRAQQYADKADATQYSSPEGLIASAQQNASFDQSLQDKRNRTMQMRDADPVTGEKIVQSYNPNNEAQRVKAEEADLSDARLAVIGRGVAEEFNPALRGIVKGGVQSLGLGAAAIGFAADAMGADGVKAWGLDVNRQTGRLANQLTLSKNATDIQSIDEFQTWLAENGGYTLYQAAESLLTAGVGGAAGKAIGKEAVGQVVAMTANNIRQTLGSVYAEAVDEAKRTGKPMPSLAQIAAGAVVSASVDTFADKLGLDALTAAGFKGNALSRLSKSLGTQMGVQGGTEALQVIPESLGAGKDPFTQEGFKQMLDEGAVGALGGGGPGVMGAINRYQAPAQPSVTSFADPNGPASQAGITPIVVPTPQNVSTPSNTGGLPVGAGDGRSLVKEQSVGVVGLGGNNGRGMGGVPGAPESVSAGNPSVSPVTGQPSASVNPVKRTADSDLLSRVAYEEEPTAALANTDTIGSNVQNTTTATGPQTQATPDQASASGTSQSAAATGLPRAGSAQIQPAGLSTPETIWTGRSGSGYDTVEAAQQAMESRVKKDPELQWKVEQRPDGKYHLAGYSTGDANGAVGNQAASVRNSNDLENSGAVTGGSQGAAIAGGFAGVADTAGRAVSPSVKQVVGDSAAARAKAQASLDYWHGREPNTHPKVTLGEPDAKADAQIQSAMQQAKELFGVSADVIAFSDPSPDSINGMEMGGRVYVNTKGLSSNALNTGWHETHHVMQAYAEADTQNGKTNTPAQRYIAKVDAIFDTMGESGKRQYIESFLYKDRLQGLTGAKREAAIQKALASDETRKEMMADFVGNRATDRGFIRSLAKADPKNFQQWAKQWLQTINDLIAELRGNGGSKQSKAVDRYVADLNKARMVVRDAMVELRNSGQTEPSQDANVDAQYQRKGVVGEVAPFPAEKDQKVVSEMTPEQRTKNSERAQTESEWNETTDPEKTSATRNVYRKQVDRVMSDMGLRGWSVDFSSGTFEGKENPNFIITAPETATSEQITELANAIGYVLDQKAMITFDESNTTEGYQASFVKVTLPSDMNSDTVKQLRNWIAEKAPAAGGDTLRDGSLVYGNFGGATDADFESAIDAAVDEFARNAGITIDVSDVLKWQSGYIEPASREAYLEGTRYGRGSESEVATGGDSIRGTTRDSRSWIEGVGRDAIAARDEWVRSSVSGRARAGVQQRALADATQSTAKAEREYGTAREGSVAKVGVHFSQQRRKLLSSEFHGTGLKGAERERAQSKDYIKDRLFFYVDNGKGVTPESGVGGVRHIVKLKNLYDVSKDPKGFGRMSTGATEQERQTKFENFVRNAGFDGYFMDKGANQDFAVLIGKHNIEMPSYSRRFKSVDEFDSGPQDFDRMNELGNFNVDTNEDMGFPDLSGADKKLDKKAELQAELDREFRQRMVDKSKLKAGPAAVTLEKMQEAGMNPESAFSLGEMTERDGAIEFDGAAGFPEAGDMYEVSEFPTGWRVGTEHSFTMGNNWTKEGAIRQFRNLVTAPFIHKAGFDIAENYRKGTALKLAQTWRNLAGKHGTFKLPARSKSMNFAEVAKEIGAISGYDILVEGNNRKEITFTDKSNGNTFNASIAMLNDGSFKCCTMGLDGSKIGSEFYAVASEWARNNGYSFASDATLSAINGFRRTEQATSFALKTGDTGVILPGVQNRVYGYNENPRSKEDHDMNIARLLIAGMRNAMEVDPDIRRLRYEPDTGKFTDSKGNDAEATVKAFLANKDARASGMGRSTLARAVLTSQIIAGGFDAGAVTKFAEPVAYSRKMGLDDALSEGYGSDPSTDGANTEFSPQFNNWFSGSKITNDNGLPMVLYHGSTRGGITQSTKQNSFFSASKEVARTYSVDDYFGRKGEAPVVQAVYLKITNPLDVDANGNEWMRVEFDGRRYTTDELAREAKRMGHDGLIVRNVMDNVADEELPPSDIYVTLGGKAQIKSAMGENVTFDPENSSVSYSRKSRVAVTGSGSVQLAGINAGEEQFSHAPPAKGQGFNVADVPAFARKQGPSERKYQDNYLVPEIAGEFLDDSGNIASMPGLVFAKDGINRTYPAMPIRVQVGEHMRDPSKVVHQYGLQHRIENKQKDVRRGYMTPEVDGIGTAPEVERAIRDIALGLYEASTVYADNAARKIYLHAPAIDRMTVLERDRDSTGKEFWNVITSMPQTRADMMRKYKAPTTVGGITYNGERTQQAFDIKRGILDKLKEPGQSPVTSESYILDDDGLLFNQPVAETPKAETPVRVLARDANGKIILNKRKSEPVSFSRRQATGLPDETKMQAVQRVMQDQYNRVKLVQDLLVESGGLVGEEQDVYRAEERMHGRVHELMRQFKDDVVQPFLDKAVAEKVDLNELALYAYAKHAKERNAHIQTFNRNVQTGSGMSDDTADNIIQMVDLAGDRQKFDDLHNDMMAMTATTRRVMLDEGLITQDQYDGLENMYQNYVPLRGFEDVEADTGKVRPGLGRGFNVKGKETIAAMGRDSAAGDIIENIIRDYERVTIRSEKNAVGKTFLDLVQNNPDPNLWEVQPIKRAARKDANGLVQYQNVDDKGEDTVAVKVAGQPVYIKIHDDLFLRAMQNTFKGEKSDSERFVLRVAGLYTSLLRNTITRFNPVFGVINAVRDSQMGAMGVYDELGAEGLKLYAKHYAGALAAGARTEVNKSDPQKYQMDRWMREMRFAGGTTGGVFMRDNETIRSELRDAMLAAGIAPNGVMDWAKHNTGVRAAKHVLHALEVIGAVSEHAARLSAYTTAREMGRTPAQAASIAKNLTVNFNRFGEQGQLINTLFLFYNAAVQGSVRIGQMAKNKKVQAAFAGMAGVGLSLALMGAAVGGDDEDGQPYWDKIPDWEKERNIIIMLPPGSDSGAKVGKHGRYIKIPMAYGLNVFPVLGYQMADVMRNIKDPTKGSSAGKAAINMVSAVMGSYNPFGGSLSAKPDATWALAVAPTIADPIIQLSQGVDGFGKSTGPTKSQFDNRPDSEIVSGAQHGKVYHRIARYLNEATGGNQAREGGIDLQPGTIKNVVGIVGGGLGKFVGDMLNLGYLGVQDLPIETRDIPVYKAFYGEYDKRAGMSQYYERSQKAMTEFASMKNEMKLGVKRGEYSDEEKFLQRMGGQAEDMSKALGELKKWEVSIAEGEGTDREKEIKRKEVQKVRERMAADYNRDWYREESKLKAGAK